MAIAMSAVFQAETWENQSGREKPVQVHKRKALRACTSFAGSGSPVSQTTMPGVSEVGTVVDCGDGRITYWLVGPGAVGVGRTRGGKLLCL